MIKKNLTNILFIFIFSFNTSSLQGVFETKHSHIGEVKITTPDKSIPLELRISNSTYLSALLLAMGISGICITSDGIKKYIKDYEEAKPRGKRRGILQISLGGLMTLTSAVLLFFGPKNLWLRFNLPTI